MFFVCIYVHFSHNNISKITGVSIGTWEKRVIQTALRPVKNSKQAEMSSVQSEKNWKATVLAIDQTEHNR